MAKKLMCVAPARSAWLDQVSRSATLGVYFAYGKACTTMRTGFPVRSERNFAPKPGLYRPRPGFDFSAYDT